MATKHFLRILFVFVGIILLGVISSFVVSYIDDNTEDSSIDVFTKAIGVAK